MLYKNFALLIWKSYFHKVTSHISFNTWYKNKIYIINKKERKNKISICQTQPVHELFKRKPILRIRWFLKTIRHRNPFPNQPKIPFTIVLVQFHVYEPSQVISLYESFSLDVEILGVESTWDELVIGDDGYLIDDVFPVVLALSIGSDHLFKTEVNSSSREERIAFLITESKNINNLTQQHILLAWILPDILGHQNGPLITLGQNVKHLLLISQLLIHQNLVLNHSKDIH